MREIPNPNVVIPERKPGDNNYVRDLISIMEEERVSLEAAVTKFQQQTEDDPAHGKHIQDAFRKLKNRLKASRK